MFWYKFEMYYNLFILQTCFHLKKLQGVMILFGNQNRNSTCSKKTFNLWDSTMKFKVDVDGAIRVDRVTLACCKNSTRSPISYSPHRSRARSGSGRELRSVRLQKLSIVII